MIQYVGIIHFFNELEVLYNGKDMTMALYYSYCVNSLSRGKKIIPAHAVLSCNIATQL